MQQRFRERMGRGDKEGSGLIRKLRRRLGEIFWGGDRAQTEDPSCATEWGMMSEGMETRS